MEDKRDHPLGEKELLLRKWTVPGNCGVYVINISHRWKKPLNLGNNLPLFRVHQLIAENRTNNAW